jgi:hypothetical protein
MCSSSLIADSPPAQQKRKRKREQLEKLQVASYIRQQTARAPVRKWTREWWVLPTRHVGCVSAGMLYSACHAVRL